MRRLIVCCDGTWNAVDAKGRPTNVAKIAQAVDTGGRYSNVDQIVCYVRGVGTTGLKTQQIVSGATGEGVDDNIRAAYLFLVQNYRPGDAIYLFGFSRGAFTARALAGMISASGLAAIQSRRLMTLAWNYYRTPPRERRRSFAEVVEATPLPGLRDTGRPLFHGNVEIQFVGVFDTVGALGIPALFGRFRERWAVPGSIAGFHDTSPSRIVRQAAQALAVDDHRPSFAPTLWTGAKPPGAVIDQTWFAGNHSDVGGGHENDALSNAPLHWMARKAEAAGLVFDPAQLPRLPARSGSGGWPAYLAPQHDSNVGLYALQNLAPILRAPLGRLPPEHLVGGNVDVSADRDWRGDVRPGINEKLHESLVERWGEKFGRDRDPGRGARVWQTTYRPPNLAPFFDAEGRVKPDVPIDRVI
jgi:uncharacterized protein (DUF2235 family)